MACLAAFVSAINFASQEDRATVFFFVSENTK